MKNINLNGTNHTIEADAENVSYGNSNVKTTLDALVEGSDNIDVSQRGYFGTNYPDQMRKIVELDQNKGSLSFVQITDTHGFVHGQALGTGGLLANSGADFLIHTGDIVHESFWDSYSSWPTAFAAEEKPCFIVLGNHDCNGSTEKTQGGAANGWNATEALALRYNKYFQPLLNNEWISDTEIADGKTYYHVDIVKGYNKYKCIFIDQSDGGTTGSEGPTPWANATIMTDTQKLWFIQQLQTAAKENFHVIIFIHVKPDYVGAGEGVNNISPATRKASGWFTTLRGDGQNCENIKAFLLGVVHAFKSGTSYTLNNTEYKFLGEGRFVGWFCGHTHFDNYGWSSTHNDQFIAVSTSTERLSNDDDINPSVSGIKTIVRYINIDAEQKKVTVFNVGNQALRDGGTRTIFTYNYE